MKGQIERQKKLKQALRNRKNSLPHGFLIHILLLPRRLLKLDLILLLLIWNIQLLINQSPNE